MDNFWGKRYGQARRVAWQRVGHLAGAMFLLVVLAELVKNLPRPVVVVVMLLAFTGVLLIVLRYVQAEVGAAKAMLQDERERRERV